jgi:hypothetical protein
MILKFNNSTNTVSLFERFGDRKVLSLGLYENMPLITLVALSSTIGGAGMILSFVSIIFSIVLYCYRRRRRKDRAFAQVLGAELSEYRKNLLYENDANLEEVALDAIRQTETYFIQYKDLSFENRIGSGAYGTVFKGTYNMTHVAIKMIQFDQGNLSDKERKEFSQEFRSEALTMARIHHPKCVLFIGLCINDGFRYIVSELMAQSLADVLATSEERNLSEQTEFHFLFTLQKKLGILDQVSQAMAYLHSQRMVHYDLKPANILLSEHCITARVCDFGTTKGKGMKFVGGTPNYVAPELIDSQYAMQGEESKCDVYSFGVVMYELFFEKRSYEVVTARLLERIAHQNIRPEMPQVRQIEHMTQHEQSYINLMKDCWQHQAQFRPAFAEIHRRISDLQQ